MERHFADSSGFAESHCFLNVKLCRDVIPRPLLSVHGDVMSCYSAIPFWLLFSRLFLPPSLCFHLSSLARSLRLLYVFQPLIYLRSTFHRNSPSQNILRISCRTKIRVSYSKIRATDGRSLLSNFGHESLSDIIWWLNGCTHRRRIPSSQSASACVDPSIWKLTPCLVGVLKPFHCEISDMCISSWQKVSSS